MKPFFLLTYCLFCLTAWAQAEYSTITKVTGGASYAFPIVSNPNKKATDKINIHLQLAELEIITGNATKDMFAQAAIDDGTIYGGKEAISYTVLENSNTNLALKLDESACGMTCAYWVRYYNFNPQTGDRYALQDFFSPANFEVFKKRMTPIRVAKLKAQIDTLNISEEGDPSNLASYIYDSIAEDDYEDFYFTKDSLSFDNDNLVNKNDKFFSLDHTTTIDLASIASLLNEYGKAAMLTGTSLATYTAVAEPQLYEGTIGTLPIYLLFRPTYDNHYEGIYAYKKYGTAITLDGEYNNNLYVFQEMNKYFKEIATFSFTKTPTGLKGSWTDKKKKSLPLNAKRK